MKIAQDLQREVYSQMNVLVCTRIYFFYVEVCINTRTTLPIVLIIPSLSEDIVKITVCHAPTLN